MSYLLCYNPSTVRPSPRHGLYRTTFWHLRQRNKKKGSEICFAGITAMIFHPNTMNTRIPPYWASSNSAAECIQVTFQVSRITSTRVYTGVFIWALELSSTNCDKRMESENLGGWKVEDISEVSAIRSCKHPSVSLRHLPSQIFRFCRHSSLTLTHLCKPSSYVAAEPALLVSPESHKKW